MGPRVAGFLTGACVSSFATQCMVHYNSLVKADSIDAYLKTTHVRVVQMHDKMDVLDDAMRGRDSSNNRSSADVIPPPTPVSTSG